MPRASFPEVERNHQRRIPTRETRKITRISWFPGSQLMDPGRVGGKTRWMRVVVEVEAGEGSRAWDRQEGGSPRWIPMDQEETLAVTVGQVVPTTLSLGLEVWARAAEVEVGTRAVEVEVEEEEEADVMEQAGMEEVPGRMTIVIAIAITLGEVTTAGGEGVIIEAVGVEIANVGEVAAAVVVEAVAGDIKLSLVYVLS